MKRIFYILLFTIPVILFILIYNLNNACGPYYIYLYDQSYALLGTAVRYTQFSFDRFFSYPADSFQVNGIPADLTVAAAMKLFFLFSGKSNDLLTDVLIRPENYLQIIQRTFLFMNCAGVLLTGIITYKTSGNVYYSVLLQISLFVSFMIYYSLTIVCLEQMLMLTALLMICLFVRYLYKNEITKQQPLKFIAALGILCGTGISVKLNFLPVLIIPFFIIKGVRNKIIYSVTCALTYFVFTLPLLFQNSQFFKWIKDLIIFNGKYGQGNPTFININSFFENITLIFSEDLIFLSAYILTLITLVFSLIKKSGISDQLIKNSVRLLTGIFAAFNIQILIVAKHYAQYYLIPSLMFSNLALMLSFLILNSIYNGSERKLNSVIIFLIFSNLIYGMFQYNKLHEILDWNRQESQKTENYVKEITSDKILITSFGCANPETAVFYGSLYMYDPEKSREILNSVLRNKIFYSPFSKNIFCLGSNEEFLILLKGSNKLYFQEIGDNVLQGLLDKLTSVKNLTVTGSEEVFKNEINQHVYEIRYEFR
ncbi:MAG: hypothetical protein JNJ56_10330 [Ignavibacteria bacterium]|nr:hypothetical protein [Ignavibacteria bacterium]